MCSCNFQLKLAEVGSVKNKFESGELTKKDYSSEARNEVNLVAQTKTGAAQSTKERYEKAPEKNFEHSKISALEELRIARAVAAKQQKEKPAEEEEEYVDRRIEDENNRYRELEEFKKAAAAKQALQRFESGQASNAEEHELEARKEVESILGSGRAADTLKIYEQQEFNKQNYVSPVKDELDSIKVDASKAKSIYESGEVQKEYDSEAKREVQSLSVGAGDIRNKYESGELLNTSITNEEKDEELQRVRSVSAAADKKNKYESGELLQKEYSSETRKELETIKTGASDIKSKYESGELLTKEEIDSEAKRELETIASGAKDKKNMYESGDFEKKDYDSEVC